MRSKISVLLMVGFVVCLCSSTLLAQEKEQKAQLYVIWEAVVQPSKVADFVAATRAEVALYAKYKFPYAWHTSSRFDNHFYFLIPVDNFAAIDSVFEAFNKVEETAGKEYQELLDMFEGTYEYIQPQIYLLNYELSLISEEGAAESEGENFLCWDIHYIHGGKEREYEEIVKEFQALYRSKNTSQDWYCYQAVIGEKNPVYYFVTSAKDAVDFYTQNAKMWDALGEEGDSFYQKLMNLLRKREMKTGRPRPDLSYTPEEK
jgi:hypothetical protein